MFFFAVESDNAYQVSHYRKPAFCRGIFPVFTKQRLFEKSKQNSRVLNGILNYLDLEVVYFNSNVLYPRCLMLYENSPSF